MKEKSCRLIHQNLIFIGTFMERQDVLRRIYYADLFRGRSVVIHGAFVFIYVVYVFY